MEPTPRSSSPRFIVGQAYIKYAEPAAEISKTLSEILGGEEVEQRSLGMLAGPNDTVQILATGAAWAAGAFVVGGLARAGERVFDDLWKNKGDYAKWVGSTAAAPFLKLAALYNRIR